ncbi:MAG: hypothetical protein EOO73_06305 [Myxococcales bacterium]|nr:MAG: hypothetical protein EOO73_06305 [Myxococcales bacterium]
MTLRSAHKLAARFIALVFFGSALLPAPARAQTAAARAPDRAARTQEPPEEELPPYHHSIFSWDHTVTAATLGVGDTPQSYNPTYTMGFVARTRYYLLDDSLRGRHFSLRLDGGLYREFTNSDVTTQRGEVTLSDLELSSVYAHRIQGRANTDGTLAELRPLTLTLPTSKTSWDSGRYFAPGVLVGVSNVTPWLRGRAPFEISSLVRFAVGYKRWLARATVPTNPTLERVRLTPDGRTLPGDTLSGSSLIRDQLDFSATLRLSLGSDVYWSVSGAIAPAWKYGVADEVSLCGVVLTGCTSLKVSGSDSRYLVRTQFSTEVSLRVAKGFSVELGYGNVANQLGADGRRRSFFYSPEAVFYASVSFFPHELVSGKRQLAQREAVSPSL